MVRKSPAKVLRVLSFPLFKLPDEFVRDLCLTDIFAPGEWSQAHREAVEWAVSAYRAAENADLKASKSSTAETLRRALAGGLKGKRALSLLIQENTSIDEETHSRLATLASATLKDERHRPTFEAAVRQRMIELDSSAGDGQSKHDPVYERLSYLCGHINGVFTTVHGLPADQMLNADMRRKRREFAHLIFSYMNIAASHLRSRSRGTDVRDFVNHPSRLDALLQTDVLTPALESLVSTIWR